jgi:hypothetical protein
MVWLCDNLPHTHTHTHTHTELRTHITYKSRIGKWGLKREQAVNVLPHPFSTRNKK